MDIIEKIQKARQTLINIINENFDSMILKLKNQNSNDGVVNTERIIPLALDSVLLKGTKPIAVLFGEERIDTTTWKKVFTVILSRCNQCSQYHNTLMELRGRLAGQVRVFLSDTPDSMKRPVKIDEEMYAETHYGAETLMHILKNRILNPINYDYSNINIVLKT